ncbi:MAG: response regulator [Herpetosiphonaceae bacterium]|nr:response regulator [Herpetosiphonaceae bacterium]
MDRNDGVQDSAAVPRLQQLTELARLVSEVGLDLETLLALIVKQISLVLGDGCAIEILSEDGQFILPVASYHPDPESLALLPALLAASPQRVGEGLSGQVAQSGTAIGLSMVTLEQSDLPSPPTDGQSGESDGVHSTMIVPLCSGDVIIGTIMVIRDRTSDPYCANDASFFRELADCAAVAIENAQLSARVISANEILDRRVDEQTSELATTNDWLERKLVACRLFETAMKKLNHRHRLILDSMGEGLIVIDWQGLCTFANPAALDMLGWTAMELLDQPKHTLLQHSKLDGSPYPQAECAMCSAIDNGTRYESNDDFFWTKSGQTVPIAVFITPLANGVERLGAVIVFNDTTRQTQIDQSLREAKKAAEDSNLAKSEFLSHMSHELRTPLNAVLGFAQVLQMDQLNPDQHASLQHILNGGHHLLTLINEVLDFARIEAGHLSLSLEPILLRSVVLETVDTIRLLAAARTITIRTDIDSFDDLMVSADRQRLRQILLNILANAVKYNRESGRIDISCQMVDPTRLKILIADTGIGIAIVNAPKLFTPFARLGAEQSDIEGSGLGLALSKLLVEAMHGTIGHTSVVGEGSTFWLELPVSVEHRQPPRLAHLPALPLIQSIERIIPVLLIEDNAPNQRLIERLLNPGFQVTVATQGQAGLDLALQQRPALILLDLHLPDMHGAEVLHQLQATPATEHIPVVIITADATAHQAERLLADGARAYLTKPFDVSAFLAIVKSIIVE